MNRYETNSKGISPALSSILNDFANMPRSAFDESRRKSFDCSPYAIIPFECFLLFPNSEGSFSFDVQVINKNPTIRRILSSMNLEIRSYICRCSDLWEGWNNFVTRGRSGKLNLSIPSIAFDHNPPDNLHPSDVLHTTLPYNPYHYLNICPPVYYYSDQSFSSNTGFGTTILTPGDDEGFKKTGLLGDSFNLLPSSVYNSGISALPGVMYCKIAKEYLNSNLLQNNPYWYPENENHDLILPYNCSNGVRNASYDIPNTKFNDTIGSVTFNSVQPTNDSTSLPWLNVLFYRQRKGNYFTTSSPFPDLLRGDVPTLDVLSANMDFTNVLDTETNSRIRSFVSILSNGKMGVSSTPNNPDPDSVVGNEFIDKLGLHETRNLDLNVFNVDGIIASDTSQFLENTPSRSQSLLSALNNATISGINFSLSEWRRLATLTVFRERLARTDGSYNQMIRSMFSHNPNWHEHSVNYLGGMSQPIVFSEVVQQSEDGSTPLGTTGGRFVSSTPDSNNIHFRTDDYAIIMNVLTITPDDYYTQGIARMWTELTQSEQYFPILNNLDPQAILNKELFVSGDDSVDNDVFAYQELFSHFKSRQNEVSGLMALPISKIGETGAYILNRLFDNTPQFNNKFVTGELTDNENAVFASTEMAQFIVSIASRFNYVAPMPAISSASNMGLSYC